MRKMLLLAVSALGCSSGIEVFPSNADVSTDDTQPVMDAGSEISADATTDVDATCAQFAETGCPCAFGFWPCDASIHPWDANICTVQDSAGLTKSYVSNSMSLTGQVSLGAPNGNAIQYTDVPNIIDNAITSGKLQYDTDGIYVLLTAADITVDGYGGLCWSYCGFHTSSVVSSGNIRYAVIGDTHVCPYSCAPFDGFASAPNGNWTADGMINILAHELSETATDPDPIVAPAWRDFLHGFEIGDKCNFDYGNFYPEVSGTFNVQIGSRKFLIQQEWQLNSPTGLADHCALAANGDAGFGNPDAFPDELDGGYQSQYWLPMEYLGGRVLDKPSHIYFVWYGNWTNGGAEVATIMADFVNNLGASEYWAMAAQYYWLPGCKGDAGTTDAGTPDVGSDAGTDVSSIDAGGQ